MSEPTQTKRQDQSHSIAAIADQYVALVKEEAAGIIDGIAETAHSVWGGISSFFGLGGSTSAAPQDGKTDAKTDAKSDGGDQGGGISLADAQKHADDAKKEAGAGDGKSGEKKKGGDAGLHKTNGADDLVATFGTAAEAGTKQKNINVYWVSGLKRVDKKTGQTVTKGGTVVEKDQSEIDAEGAEPKSKAIPVHEKIAPLFQEIFDAIKKDGAWKHILEMPWAYTPRENRNNATEWSIHSWGTAMDVNATTNPNGVDGATAHQKAISSYFTDRGFTWLEHSDAMHFQYHDGGAPQITNADLDDVMAGKISGTNVKTLLADIKNSRAKAEKSLAAAKSESSKKRYQARIDRLDEMAKYLGGEAG